MTISKDFPLVTMDTFEPMEIERELRRTLQVVRWPLKQAGLNDYLAVGHQNQRTTFERKKAYEFVSEIGQQLERQLADGMRNADSVALVLEGFLMPADDGSTICVHFGDSIVESEIIGWKPTMKRKVFARVSTHQFDSVQAFLWQLQRHGILLIPTINERATARVLSSIIYNDLKPLHTTLGKHQRTMVKPETPDPYVETLMGVRIKSKQGGTTGVGMGEVAAKKAIEEFANPIGAYMAEETDLIRVLGPALARRFLNAIGRGL